MKSELVENSQLIIDYLKKKEKSDSEVYANHVSDIKIIFEHKDFSLSSNYTNTLFGIRSIINGRLGFSTTNSVSKVDLERAADEAQLVAKLSPPSEHHQISQIEYSEKESLECFDEALAQLPVKEIYDYAQLIVDTAQKDPRIIIERAEFNLATQYWSVVNSKGVKNSSRQSSCNWSVMGVAKEDGQVTGFDYDGGCVWQLPYLEKEIIKTVDRFRDGTIKNLKPQFGTSYKGLLLLHPVAVLELFGEHFEFNCNGRAHQDGMSSWKERVGDIVTSEDINVFEDPRDTKRPEGWTPFDREGVKTQKHFLIQEGKLNFLAHNCFSAHRGSTKPTGNASGGARGLPAIGFHNLTIEGAKNKLSDQKIFQMLNNGLLLKRFSGNTDPTGGIFSGVAKNSSWYKNGEYSHPVHEIMVAGNMFEILKNIVAIGDTLHPTLGGGQAPYILVDGANITAGA